MISVGILEAINVYDAFIDQSRSRSSELKIEVSDYVIHSFPKLCGDQRIRRRLPPPLERHTFATRIDFVPERHVSVNIKLKRLRWVRAFIDAVFDYNGKKQLIESTLETYVLDLVLNASQNAVTVLKSIS